MKESNFQFISPYLVDLDFKINPGFGVNNDLEMQIDMNNTMNVNVSKFEGQNMANVSLTLELNIDNEQSPFQLRATVASDFKWENVNEEKLKGLLERNAPALLLGYLRPIVANVTNVSPFPAYNLPFVNFNV